MKQPLKRAQYIGEMVILLAVVLAMIVGMQTYAKRGVQAKIKHGVDEGIGLANKSLSSLNLDYGRRDKLVYQILQCMNNCEEDFIDYGNLDDLTEAGADSATDQCVREKCIATREFLKANLSYAQMDADRQLALIDSQYYDYGQLYTKWFLEEKVFGTTGTQYEPYYSKSQAGYDMKQATRQKKEGSHIYEESFSQTQLVNEAQTGFATGDDDGLW